LRAQANTDGLSDMIASLSGLLVNIDVDDLARGVRFYTGAFGLRVGRRLGPSAVELLGGPAPLYLLENAADSAPLPGALGRRTYARHWTPVHLDFVVTDIDAAHARVLAEGAFAEGVIRDVDYGRIAQLADPFGHGLCLIEFNAAGYDAIADP
jgi:predicted enzyme related to lactoylglutathione lyase